METKNLPNPGLLVRGNSYGALLSGSHTELRLWLTPFSKEVACYFGLIRDLWADSH